MPPAATLHRQHTPLLEEDGLLPAAEIGLGALLRWCWLGIFPCYDVPDFKRQQKIRSDLSVGEPSYPTVRRWCQSRRHRCCWLCCACFGPLLAVIVTALYIFYSAYLPAVSRQHPALFDTRGAKIDAHGGHMMQHEGVVYWYGESRKSLSARGYPVGVNQGWTNEGVRFPRRIFLPAYGSKGIHNPRKPTIHAYHAHEPVRKGWTNERECRDSFSYRE